MVALRFVARHSRSNSTGLLPIVGCKFGFCDMGGVTCGCQESLQPPFSEVLWMGTNVRPRSDLNHWVTRGASSLPNGVIGLPPRPLASPEKGSMILHHSHRPYHQQADFIGRGERGKEKWGEETKFGADIDLRGTAFAAPVRGDRWHPTDITLQSTAFSAQVRGG